MKEFLLENTSITEDEYEKIIGCDKDLTIDDANDEYILSHENALIMYDISNFTLDSNYKKDEFIKNGPFYNHKGVSFAILSDYYYDEFLKTPVRFGRCHIASYAIAINSFFDTVTMICTDFQSGKDFLHTVLYTKETNEVIDYTLNLIMDKDIYFDLMNARAVSYITNENIKELDKNVRLSTKELKDNINVKELLCFPEEINNLALKLKK